MNKLNNVLHELGISKVKLAKYLGVSRQMIYNYLELDDINKWPKDKKVLLFNLLDIKSSDELDNIKVDTDYIEKVEGRVSNVVEAEHTSFKDDGTLYNGLDKKSKELLHNIIDLEKELLDDPNDAEGYNTALYLYYLLQNLDNSKELKYQLGYIAKKNSAVKVDEYVFDKAEQFNYEAIMFTADTLYHGGTSAKSRLDVAHKRFQDEVERRMEEEIGRTRQLMNIKEMALKELGLKKDDDNSEHAPEINRKMAEIESRTINSYRK